jgi:RNA polymerase sigma factor (TIGR02999 family)
VDHLIGADLFELKRIINLTPIRMGKSPYPLATGDCTRKFRMTPQDLLPLVYDELRKLAAVKMASEKPGQTLDATALVHEAYLRLGGDQQFEGRGHFFAAAGEAMRRILVESSRGKQAEKYGSELQRQPLEPELVVFANQPDLVEVLAIQEDLDQSTLAIPGDSLSAIGYN